MLHAVNILKHPEVTTLLLVINNNERNLLLDTFFKKSPFM